MFVQSVLAVSLDDYNIRPALTIPEGYAPLAYQVVATEATWGEGICNWYIAFWDCQSRSDITRSVAYRELFSTPKHLF